MLCLLALQSREKDQLACDVPAPYRTRRVQQACWISSRSARRGEGRYAVTVTVDPFLLVQDGIYKDPSTPIKSAPT